jgi:hypothetical protein
MRWAILSLFLFTTTLGCAHPPAADTPGIAVQLQTSQTCEKLGACQGASQHDGFVYLYGDANPGIIRQYIYSPGPPRQLVYTGLDIALTYHGANLINHPTGLTWNPQFGTYLGNTVTATKKGTIYHLDWPRMLIDRNLDHAILNVTDDDEAIQGCRPEFVRRGDQWLLATADYGSRANAVRYYDPAKLATAHKTSDPGVMVASYPCGPFVQQLHWIDERGELLIIQNITGGRGWRLRAVHPWSTPVYSAVPPLDLAPKNELEGATLLSMDECILVTSSRGDNVTFAAFALP